MKSPWIMLGAVVLAAFSRAPSPDTTVVIKGFGFTPKTLEIPVGTRVRWDNQDEIEHTATAASDSGAVPLFNGVMAGKGQSFSFTFDRAGTFVYACSRHAFMRGEIRVTPRGEH